MDLEGSQSSQTVRVRFGERPYLEKIRGTLQRQVDICEFQPSLVHIMSFRPVKYMVRPCLQKNLNNNKNIRWRVIKRYSMSTCCPHVHTHGQAHLHTHMHTYEMC